jgi:hypothetical protein
MSEERQLTFASGGWVLLAALALVAALLAWALLGVMQGRRPIGDGMDIATYGFDLGSATIPVQSIVSSGNPRDFLRPLDDPAVIPAADVLLETERIRGKHLVSTDRVIGVVVNGEARAYPLRMLNGHEIVNDTLGGEPIAVVYSPLCDAAAAFSRRVGDGVLAFRVSGLLHNANILMYSSGPEGDTLWSQLRARAVAGPGAVRGDTLDALPCSVATWGDWRLAFPESTVLAANPSMQRLYKQMDYERYFQTPDVDFPIAPPPPAGGPSAKARVLVVSSGGERHVLTYESLVARTGGAGFVVERVGELDVKITVGSDGRTVMVAPAEGAPTGRFSTIHAFWFAWHAMHSEDAAGVSVPDDAPRPRMG